MRAPVLLSVLVGVLASSGCHPFGNVGDSCEKAPCAAGLVCDTGICVEPRPAPPDPDACEVNDDCALHGSADGRACVDGRCVWRACGDDGDCDGRVCDRGVCAEREVCGDDDDCAEGRVCEDGACRSACVDDGACGGFSACEEGRCFSRCFLDLMCFGDVCEDGLCRPPACALDEDCPSDGAYFCDAGRCVSFLPCGDDDDCFDPDYRCNELGRCEERPACRVDPECGAEALCLGGRCRPATSCVDDSGCEAADECVAGRCVDRLTCRANADCASGEACVGGSCAAIVPAPAAALVVGTPLGDCEAGGEGACTLVLFEGERVHLRIAAFADDGAPVAADLDVISTSPADAAIAELGHGLFALDALAAGSATLDVTTEGGARNDAVQVIVLPAVTAGLGVLVIDERTGAPVPDAIVDAGSASASTDASGLAVFPVSSPGELLLTARDATRGIALFGAPSTGALRLALSAAPLSSSSAAGFTATVRSSGDETGPVGIGLALPGLASADDAGLGTLLGPAFVGALDIPILGAVPVELPAAATLEATLPVLGVQVVRERAFATTRAGRRSALVYEGRFPEASLFELVGGADATELALNLAAEAEGMDVLAVHAGAIGALPLVVDGDLSDGVGDVDNDGDTGELVPDFANLPALDVTPERLPRERVGLEVTALPPGARARAFVAAGLELPGYGFAPTGIGAITPSGAGAPEIRSAQVKVQPPADAALAAAERVVVVEALFDEPGLRSRLVFRGERFGPSLALGAFLSPPSGVVVLDGIPAPGERLLVLPDAPGATTWRISFAGGVSWTLVAAARAGGASVVLPASLSATSIERVELLRLEGSAPELATLTPFVAGGGPLLVERAAKARASAPPR